MIISPGASAHVLILSMYEFEKKNNSNFEIYCNKVEKKKILFLYLIDDKAKR